MIEELSGKAKDLAVYMSNLSEKAYSAGWMDGLEYALWSAVLNGPRIYGRLAIKISHIESLMALSEEAGGWIYFHGEQEEIFIDTESWKRMYAENYQYYKGKTS